ncbi:MAG: ABC transporter permease [Bergeyella sp.]|nr:ABC transporter permease [Bergeyella sp.]
MKSQPLRTILLITKREFLTQVRRKSFIILTLLGPFMVIGFGVLVAFLYSSNNSTAHVKVVESSYSFPYGKLSKEKVIYFPATPHETKNFKSLLLKDSANAFLFLPDIEKTTAEDIEKQTEIWVRKKLNIELKRQISGDLKKILQQKKIKSLHLTEDQIKDIDKDVTVEIKSIDNTESTDSELSFLIKSILGMVLMYVVFMFIVIYGVRIMRSILEEKNNRVVEIIVSSVPPFHLMTGKILGVTGVALTQFFVWIFISLIAVFAFNIKFLEQKNIPLNSAERSIDITNIQQGIMEISHGLLELNVVLIIFVFVVYFLLGYLFYSSLYAAIGSAVENETETQQFTIFAILPLMIGIYGSLTIAKNPEGTVSFWLSMIPFTSPVGMVARIPFGVPTWELLLSLSLLLSSTLIMVYIAGKIYKTGILRYSHKTTLKNLFSWMKK